jgi:hypothetical protein
VIDRNEAAIARGSAPEMAAVLPTSANVGNLSMKETNSTKMRLDNINEGMLSK